MDRGQACGWAVVQAGSAVLPAFLRPGQQRPISPRQVYTPPRWLPATRQPAPERPLKSPRVQPRAGCLHSAHLPQAPALAGLHSMYFWYSVRQRSMLPSCSSISMYDLNSLSCGTEERKRLKRKRGMGAVSGGLG